MIDLPGFPRHETSGARTALENALDDVACELVVMGALECEVDALANSAAIVIAEKLREILRKRPKALRTGKLWNPSA